MTASRTTATLAASIAGLIVVPMALAGPASGATDQWAVPSSASIRIDGHGYGHGHGMSQHGAQGAAIEGLSHKKILKFYYPGTKIGSAKGRLAVLITADTSKDVLVAANKSLRLKVNRSGAKNIVLRLASVRPKAKRWRIVPVSGGKVKISFKTSRWRTLRTVKGQGQFFTPGGATTLVLPGNRTVKYRGALRSVQRDTVNLVSLETYLRGVVPLEIPALWKPQAVQSQAVAARTYAAFERADRSGHYDICDTTSCQVYGGASAEHPASNAAIKATKGEVVTYRGAPAFTQFSASNGGWSTTGSQPYLKAKQDPYDDWAGNSNASWTTTVTDVEIEKALPALGNLTGISFSGRDGNGEWGGRVGSVTLTGSSSSRTMSGSEFRSMLGLRSEWINLTVTAQ
ncbi:SpoIID/LytB domain-containing protein [Nocardioides sp.]|uniref:SpoIID/LytB domain-containing protein n=1 Tax=Nocardioides sp. TaxID=35761 RepID=UPI003561C335